MKNTDPIMALKALYDLAVKEIANPHKYSEIEEAGTHIHMELGIPPDDLHAEAQIFDEFWQIYPRRVGKPSAKRAFNRLSKKDQRALMDHLPKRKWPGDKQYIPHPGTFIHQRRWEDEDQATTVTAQDDIF